jgi:hypothetical protein
VRSRLRETERNGETENTMLTRNGEIQAWNRFSLHEKSCIIVLLYIGTALVPWLSVTAFFSFLFGRAYGVEVEKLSCKLEREREDVMRARLIREFQNIKIGEVDEVDEDVGNVDDIGEDVDENVEEDVDKENKDERGKGNDKEKEERGEENVCVQSK